ncbi:mitotic checkpoint protein BUB3.3-like [Rhodamnia argentea]|uniref:Mitotic checkpoint protein BUB3.3-like n=1 Tax=Rhodamnia argentea TaxID=178133 RepID=A0ABM3HEH0_9MYRT|nr:mitotic checkpoint protein BUB3.3-like [Rhodamnia argentea]
MIAARQKLDNPIRDAISRAQFAPQSNNLLVSSWDSCLRLFDVDGSELRLEAPCEAALLSCCFQEESVAFGVGSDGSVIRYNLHTGSQDTIGSHADIATCIECSDQTRQVITAGLDKKLVFWDTRMDNVIAHSINVNGEVESLSVSGCNLMVAIGNSACVYDLRNLKRSLQLKESPVDARIRCISSSVFFKGFAVGSVDGRVAVEISSSSNSNDSSYTFRCHPKAKNGRNHLVSVNDIVFNPLGLGSFVTGDDEGYVALWDARNKRRLFELPRFGNSVASLSYSHGARLLAVASSYTYQEANELEELPEIHIFELNELPPGSASASSSGTELSLSLSLSLYLCCDSFDEAMSDEEHHFESKADAGASKTYPQQAGTIRKNGYIVIKNRPCKVVEVSTSKTGKHGHAKCHFVGIDIFNGKKLEDIVPSSHNCDVPHVTRTDYQLIDISEDGFLSLLTENGSTKDDLRLPTDETLLAQIKDGFGEGKDLVVTAMSSMGEEQICALKDIGPK